MPSVTVEQWIKDYEDVEASKAPDRRSRLWSLSMTMPEEALRRILAWAEGNEP